MNAPARILVVDDEKLIRWSVSERLVRAGHQVETAETGEQAVELIRAQPRDVVVLDVRLPGIDGVAVLRSALDISPELVVIMMSASSEVDTAVEAMKLGAIDFLVKPFAFTALDSAIERAVATVTTRKQLAASSDRPGRERGVSTIIGTSPASEQLREMVARLAGSNATTVLVEGESGVGKEVVARAIHFESPRADRQFVHVNCAALPEQLIESELFGHERGAFTDARTQKAGLFETANGGTVMLDEIGDLPPSGQAKLLVLLENKTFRRIGGTAELRADVRVIAATNYDLERRVSEGKFRSDLYFRLNVVRIQVPTLRERKADIPVLSSYFINRYNQEMRRSVREIAPEAMRRLMAHNWPGNIRELRNVFERAFILHSQGEEIRAEHLPATLRDRHPDPPAAQAAPHAAPAIDPLPEGPEGYVPMMDAMERRMVAEAMEKARGNQTRAAQLLGITRDMLRYRLKKFGP